jgi:hypothetical protein
MNFFIFSPYEDGNKTHFQNTGSHKRTGMLGEVQITGSVIPLLNNFQLRY